MGKKRMWIKEHEFARVKLADQKYKSKRLLETYPQNDFETGKKKVEEENGIEGAKQTQIEEEIKEYEEALHRIKLRQQSYYCMDHLDEDESLKSNMSEKEKSKLDQWREKMKFTKKAISSQRLGIMAELRELKKVSVKDKIAAFSSKVEEKPVKKVGSLSQSKWRSSSLRKAGY